MNCVQLHSHVILWGGPLSLRSLNIECFLCGEVRMYVHTIRATCYQPMLGCVHLHCVRVCNGCRAMGEGADVLLSFLCVAVCCWVLAMCVRSFKWLSWWWVWIVAVLSGVHASLQCPRRGAMVENWLSCWTAPCTTGEWWGRERLGSGSYVFDMPKYMCLCERWLIDESGSLGQMVTDIRTYIIVFVCTYVGTVFSCCDGHEQSTEHVIKY